MGDNAHAQKERQAPFSRAVSWACVKIDGPGLGVVTFADEDLSNADPSWYCTQNHAAVQSAHVLRTIEEELYKLAFKKLFPR